MRIGVDLDGGLVDCIGPLLKWHNHKYRTNFIVDQVLGQDLSRLWGCSEKEVIRRCNIFYKSKYFRDIKPVPCAQEGIEKLSRKNELFAVTARPLSIEKGTLKCVNTYFPDRFEEIILTDEFSQNGSGTNKLDIYSEKRIELVIEDSLINAIDCAVNNIDVILINYPWNKSQKLHDKIKRVENWNELQRKYYRLWQTKNM